MPYCPQCKTEYIFGIRSCADCGAALVERLPETAAARCSDQEPLEAICEAEDGIEAAEIRATLDRHGIRSLLQGGRVMVLAGDAAKALELIRDFLEPGQPAEFLTDEDLVPVYEAPDQFLAAAVESLLQHEGISAAVQSRQMPMFDGLAMMQHPAWGAVLVLQRDAGRARALVDAFLKTAAADCAAGTSGPVCAACGRTLRPEARYCDQCGARVRAP